MAGTKAGGLKAAQTNKARYGETFYEGIGKTGGTASKGGGWAWLSKNDPERLKEISRKGGTNSVIVRRRKRDM